LSPRHRQQRSDVVHHRLHASPDQAKPIQAQQVQCGGAQLGHHAGTVASVVVGVLMELGACVSVPALYAPSVAHQLQQGFWRGAQAGVAPRGAPGGLLQVGGLKRLVVTSAAGRDFHDPAGADPGLADVLWSLLGAQSPGDVAAMTNFVIGCHNRDVKLSLELRTDLAVQRLLIGSLLRRSLQPHRQQEAGPLHLELTKKGAGC
jgi:hypothetical protein